MLQVRWLANHAANPFFLRHHSRLYVFQTCYRRSIATLNPHLKDEINEENEGDAYQDPANPSAETTSEQWPHLVDDAKHNWRSSPPIPEDMLKYMRDITRGHKPSQLLNQFVRLNNTIKKRVEENIAGHQETGERKRRKRKQKDQPKLSNESSPFRLPPLEYDPDFTRAHTAFRMETSFDVLRAVLEQVKQAAPFPEYKPVTVLDFGTGQGTGIWAVDAVWTPKTSGIGSKALRDRVRSRGGPLGVLEQICLVEPSQSMQDAAKLMLRDFDGVSGVESLTQLLS